MNQLCSDAVGTAYFRQKKLTRRQRISFLALLFKLVESLRELLDYTFREDVREHNDMIHTLIEGGHRGFPILLEPSRDIACRAAANAYTTAL